MTGSDVTWTQVPDPSGSTAPTRDADFRLPPASTAERASGTTTASCTSRARATIRSTPSTSVSQLYSLIWSAGPDPDPEAAVLSGVDNITVSAGTGDLYVAEDGGTMEVVILTPDGQVAPFCRVPGHEGSEITGPCFDPSGERLYFSSQRAPTPKGMSEIVPAMTNDDRFGGATFEITGPFNGATPPAPTTTAAPPTTAPPTHRRRPPQPGHPAPSHLSPKQPLRRRPTRSPRPRCRLRSPPWPTPPPKQSSNDDGSGMAIGVGVAAAAAAAIGAAVSMHVVGPTVVTRPLTGAATVDTVAPTATHPLGDRPVSLVGMDARQRAGASAAVQLGT